ncbi:hypothetical protein ONZ51_g9289 [Trametes cubensis]|uniref:Fungal-type protein kinase domain-containing protein n=1 Tax=Trametes cubensis TaxID=1111947 RepID=A0AAD7TLP2_9APHY|nr:hypothetical protein ONZ51_g9289 [Trametes cubensis]
MPVAAFMDTFLRTTSTERSDLLSPRNAFNAVPERADSAAEVYEPLYKALSKSTKYKSRCPGFVFDQTIGRSTRPSRLGYAKPHICCFTPENLKLVEQADQTARVELGYAELIVQVAADPSLDFFVDPDVDTNDADLATHDFVRSVSNDRSRHEEITRAFGLHTSFATEIFARQHRVFLFTVSLAGSLARFIRWDRSGCIVSRAFDIRDSPGLLAEFLWRFSKLTDAERGYDLTVETASVREEELFRDVIRTFLRVQMDGTEEELEQALSTHYQPGHVALVPVQPQHSEPDDMPQYFLVSRPVVSPLTLDGRSTRGYWSVDTATRHVCFLKDTWRTFARPGSEGETLQNLNKLGVRNIPLLATHGDVYSRTPPDRTAQDTQTDQFVDESWARRIGGKDVIVQRRRHYRLVTHTVGYGLQNLRGTEELLYATYDAFVGEQRRYSAEIIALTCFKAMQDAFTKDKRLHRDLSVGNIILVREPDRAIRRGYLIDWDASIRVDKEGQALREGRAGTWSFMSARMLSYNHMEYKHTFKDDMESLLYVVLYCALLYLPHRFIAKNLTALYNGFFEEYQDFGTTIYGGVGKTANRADRMWTKLVRFDSPALQEWLDTVMNYHSPLIHEREKYRGMWEPDELDAFWSSFLETHELERDNRTVHKLSMVSHYDPDSPPTDPPTPPSPSPLPYADFTSSSSDVDPDEGPERKRSRIDDTQLARACSPAPARGGGGGSPVVVSLFLRRSQRIRDQQNKPKAVAGAVPAPPPAASAPRKRGATAAQLRGRGRGRGRGRSRK